jgi:cobalt-zinc-cadmium efflux system outer membrane protein
MAIVRRISIVAAIFLAVSASLLSAQLGNSPPASAGGLTVQDFRDSAAGLSSMDIVRRALVSNADLTAARLEVERARGRLRQAGLRPNPTIDVEQITGRFTGSPEEKEFSVGVSVPLELGGKRGRRIDLASADLEAAEAEVADRERRLTSEVRAAFAEAMAALRELEITAELNSIDDQTVRFVQARVTEGDTPPLELNLLRADADRLRSRRSLVQGRLQAAMLRLKTLAGIPANDVLRFREELTALILPEPPTLQEALDAALKGRPDLRLARLSEELAEAGLRLTRAQAVPDVTVWTRFGAGTMIFDNTPVGVLTDRDRALSFGASISLPVFNRNQGAQLEARASVAQARSRREYLESLVRAEVGSAYSRYEAARQALTVFEPGVLQRSQQNIQAVRGAYEIGAFRITDLLNEQRRLLDFQREFTEALTERYRALADLQAAIGMPVNP